MPGAVARTSTFALNNVTLPFTLALADKGWRKALADDKHLRAGLNVPRRQGDLRSPSPRRTGLAYMSAESMLGPLTSGRWRTEGPGRRCRLWVRARAALGFATGGRGAGARARGGEHQLLVDEADADQHEAEPDEGQRPVARRSAPPCRTGRPCRPRAGYRPPRPAAPTASRAGCRGRAGRAPITRNTAE